MSKAIHLIRPIIPIIPEVEKPTSSIPFREKVLWTTCALLIYMVCSNLPLYGVQRARSSDPFYWMRVVLASNRGTLMELGVSPLVTTGMVMQLLAGAKVIDVNLDAGEDRVLFMAAQKVVGLLVTLAMAASYVLSGTYGDVSAIGAGNAMLIVAQLTSAGWVLLMLDEMLQRGYGLGSGISLFIASHVSETIVWKALSPVTINTGRGTEFEGAILAFFHLIVVRRNKFQAIGEALLRQNLPNLTSLMATVLIFMACIYMEGWRVNLTVKLQKARGLERPYPIKLFYCSNMPIILQTAFVSNVFFVSQMLYKQSPGSPFIKLFGEWSSTTSPDNAISQHSVPVGGLAYYISPPASFSVLLHDPFHAIFYLLFTLTACAVFGRMWTEVSGTSVRDVSRHMRDNQVVMKGHRDTATAKILSRYIPIAAALGGICIGLLTVLADYLGECGRCDFFRFFFAMCVFRFFGRHNHMEF
jgi:protein transport protein SEC61 subunit alpha